MAFRQKPQICQHGPPTTVDFLVKPLEKAKAGKAITVGPPIGRIQIVRFRNRAVLF